MTKLSVRWKGKVYECETYEDSDLPTILDVFFFWKTAALLAKTTESKNPPLPEKFSARFCCFVSGLAYKKPGPGPDAFRLGKAGSVKSSVELKATITSSGFTDVKRDLNFDELYWLSFTDHNALTYEVYRFKKDEIKFFVEKSKTERDRATMNLKNVVDYYKLRPIQKGRIGVIVDNDKLRLKSF